MSEPVRARRAAIVAGVLVAIYVVATFLVRPVPDAIIALLGGPEGGVARYGGLRMHYRPSPGTEAAFAVYVASRADVRRDGDVLVLEFPGVAEHLTTEITDVLVGGGLAMREALETDYVTRVVEVLQLAEASAGADVWFDVDMWQAEDSGERHTVMYLAGTSVDALERVVTAAVERGVTLPAGHELGLEWVVPWSADAGVPPHWRAYELAPEVLIDGTMIANAMGSWDPNSNRPIVLLDLTREGGRRFCDVTARVSGRKLAIVLGGRVRSAPVINGAICGGRASITMGGGDPETQQRERDALVAVLAQGAVPPGGVVEHQRWIPAPDLRNQEWAGRLLLGFVIGGVAGLLVLVAIRVAKPQRAVAPPTAGAFPWRRLAVTALAPLAAIAGAEVALPSVNMVELEHVVPTGLGLDASVFALGVTPLLSAFAIVELVALAIPRLRWRRHDVRGRVRLGQAVAVLAILAALAQGYFYAVYLEALSRGGVEIVGAPGWGFRLLTMASLVTGTLLLAILAGVIREHGLGNGYVAIIVSVAVVEIVRPYLASVEPLRALVGRTEVLAAVAVALTAVATASALRWRITTGARAPALRVPTAGLEPLTESGGIVLLLTLVTAFGVTELLSRAGLERAVVETMGWVAATRTRVGINVALLAIGVVVWSWAFARPALIARVALQAGLEPPTLRAWWRATLATGVVVGAAGVVWIVTRATDERAGGLAEPVTVMLATAAVLDVLADARAHRQVLVPAGVLHQVQYAGVVERVLADAGIPCHLHASHVRTLLAFFGPFAPVVVMVPAEFGDAARANIDDALRAPSATVPAARAQPSERDVA